MSYRMHATPPGLPLGFSRAMRIVTALVTMMQLLIVAAAPLADRPDSDVAAVHVEPGGTSAHHAHDDLCATCVALHLLWTPPRGPIEPITASAHTRPLTDQATRRSWLVLAVLLPRAPPV